MKDVLKYVLDMVIKLVPLPKLPDGLVAVQPLILELLQSDAILTPELQANLQRKIIHALRLAGLKGGDL